MLAHTIFTGATGNVTGRDPRTALSRAEAAMERLAERLSKYTALPTGDRLVDALGATASNADESGTAEYPKPGH